ISWARRPAGNPTFQPCRGDGALHLGAGVAAAPPDAPLRLEQELALRLGLGAALSPVKGWSAPEMGEVLARTRELCRQIGETPHLFPVLWGLWAYYHVRAEKEPALELAKQMLSIAQSAED